MAEYERNNHVRYVRRNEQLTNTRIAASRKVELGSYGMVNGIGQVLLSPEGVLRYYPVVYVNMARPDGDLSTYVFWADELEPVRPAFTVEQAVAPANNPIGWDWNWVLTDTRAQWVIRDNRIQALVRAGDLAIYPILRWASYDDAQEIAAYWNWCPRHLAPKVEADRQIRMSSQHKRVCLACLQEYEW